MCETRRRCCFCLTLRTGCLVSGVYTVLVGAMAMAASVWMLTDGLAILATKAERLIRENNPDMEHEVIEKKIRYSIMIHKITFYVITPAYGIWMLSAPVLIYGVLMKKRNYLVLWICVTWFLLAITVLSSVNYFREILQTDVSRGVIISVLVITFFCNAFGVSGVTSYFNTNCREMDTCTDSNNVLQCIRYKECPPPPCKDNDELAIDCAVVLVAV